MCLAAGNVKELNAAFPKHLGTGFENRFVKVQDEKGGSAWKKVSFCAWECYVFTEPVDATAGSQAQMKICSVIRELFPVKSKPSAKDREDQKNVEAMCKLWEQFGSIMKQMRSRDAKDPALWNFGKNCRDFGARWCTLLPQNRCNSHYLHAIMMHAAEFQEYLLEIGLTLGMVENSGAERRHQIGKRQYLKSVGLVSGANQRFKMYQNLGGYENRTAYFTLRGILIWQFGTDMLAHEMARRKLIMAQHAGEPMRDRTRAGSGWNFSESKKHFEAIWASKLDTKFIGDLGPGGSFLDPVDGGKMQRHRDTCTVRDTFDDEFIGGEEMEETFMDAMENEDAPMQDVALPDEVDEPCVDSAGMLHPPLHMQSADDSESEEDSATNVSELSDNLSQYFSDSCDEDEAAGE